MTYGAFIQSEERETTVTLNSSSANTNDGVAWDGANLRYNASGPIAWCNGIEVTVSSFAPTVWQYDFGGSSSFQVSHEGRVGGRGPDVRSFYFIDGSSYQIKYFLNTSSDLTTAPVDSSFRGQFDYDRDSDISIHANESNNTMQIRVGTSLPSPIDYVATLTDLSSIQDLCIISSSSSQVTLQVIDGTTTYNYTITLD